MHLQNQVRIPKFLNMDVSKTSDHIHIKIKMPNSSQETPASSKASNQNLKDMDVLCTFTIKIEGAKIWNKVVSKTSGHIQIGIKIPCPKKEPPVFSKATNQNLKDMEVLCIFQIK